MFETNPPRGEFVIVCEGAPSEGSRASGQVPDDRILEDAGRLAAGGRKKREIAKILAGRYGLRTSDVYDIIVKSSAGSREGEQSGG
jgi:hypothetical protein